MGPTPTSVGGFQQNQPGIAKTPPRLSPCYAVSRPPPFPVERELGCSPTLSSLFNRTESYYFDPFSLATDDNFARYRESELKHGRIAMLALVEVAASTFLEQVSQATGAHPPWNLPSPHVWDTLHDLTEIEYAKVILTCALLETAILVQRDPQDMPGDYGVGYFGIRDKARNERRLIVELEHGRFCMIVLAAYALKELYSDVLGNQGKDWWNAVLQFVGERVGR